MSEGGEPSITDVLNGTKNLEKRMLSKDDIEGLRNDIREEFNTEISEALSGIESLKKRMLTRDDFDKFAADLHRSFAAALDEKDETIKKQKHKIAALEDKVAVCENAIDTIKCQQNNSEQ